MIGIRQLSLVAAIGSTLLAGGCAVYATPGDVGVAVVPPPVVVAPLVVRPWGGWGYRGYGRPRYFARPHGHGGHRYYRY